jgi:hypothetical protein
MGLPAAVPMTVPPPCRTAAARPPTPPSLPHPTPAARIARRRNAFPWEPGQNRTQELPMPMRAYRASRAAINTSTGQASAHVSANKTLWMLIAAVVAAGAFFLNWNTPGRAPSVWGDIGAVATMFLGILVMMKAQEGYVPPASDDDEDDVPGPA